MFYRFFMCKKEPVVISVNEKEFEQLKKDIENSTLGDKEKKIIVAILEAHHWLSQLYRAKRLSVQRVKRLFGFKSEKEKKKMGMEERARMISPVQKNSFIHWKVPKKEIPARSVP